MMIPNLGRLVKQKRLAAGLRIVDLSRRAGLGDRQKTLRQIEALEKGCLPLQRIFAVIPVLGITAAELDEARRQDEAGWKCYLDEPIPMTLTMRVMPAVYSRLPMPQGLTRDKAIAYALTVFHERLAHRRTGTWHLALRVSRREIVEIHDGGEVRINRNDDQGVLPPQMFLSGRPVLVSCSDGGTCTIRPDTGD